MMGKVLKPVAVKAVKSPIGTVPSVGPASHEGTLLTLPDTTNSEPLKKTGNSLFV